MHIAAIKGCDYTVECLIKKGANISIKDNAGVSVTILLMIAPSIIILLSMGMCRMVRSVMFQTLSTECISNMF